MEETKTKDGLKITTKDLKELQRQQNRHFGEMWEPGSVLDRFEDALNQLSEGEIKILNLYHVKNKNFDSIANLISRPPLNVYGNKVREKHEKSMKKLVEELGLSQNKISLLFNLKDVQQKTLKMTNVLSL